jgi:ArsR family transcriptional regulator
MLGGPVSNRCRDDFIAEITVAIVVCVTAGNTHDIVHRRLTINVNEVAAVKTQDPRDARTPAGSIHDPVAIAGLAKALAHPARLGIVEMLHERQGCIGCDIVGQIGLAQSTTSEHLRILKTAGIITGEVEGPRVCYALNPSALEPLRRLLSEIAAPAAKAT